MFDFVVLRYSFFSTATYLAERLAWQNISKMTYFVSGEM